jgi:hypothetical protein
MSRCAGIRALLLRSARNARTGFECPSAPPKRFLAAQASNLESPVLEDHAARSGAAAGRFPAYRERTLVLRRSFRPLLCRFDSREALVDPVKALMQLSIEEPLKSLRSSSTNVAVMVAVITARKPIPTNMTRVAITLVGPEEESNCLVHGPR